MKENFDPKPEIIGKTGEIVHSWYRSISLFWNIFRWVQILCII